MPPLSGVVSPFGLSPGKIFCVSVGEEKKNSPRPSPPSGCCCRDQVKPIQAGETSCCFRALVALVAFALPFSFPLCVRLWCALVCSGVLWRSRVSASSVLPFLLFCSSKPDHRLRQRGRHTHIHNTDKQRKADTQILPYLLTGNERTLGHRSYRLLFPCSRAHTRQDSWT